MCVVSKFLATGLLLFPFRILSSDCVFSQLDRLQSFFIVSSFAYSFLRLHDHYPMRTRDNSPQIPNLTSCHVSEHLLYSKVLFRTRLLVSHSIIGAELLHLLFAQFSLAHSVNFIPHNLDFYICWSEFSQLFQPVIHFVKALLRSDIVD
jgi:hypothetical protein